MTGTFRPEHEPWAVVRALDPEAGDLSHVVNTARAAGLSVMVVLQGSRAERIGWQQGTKDALAGCGLIASPHPLGMGGAVKAAWRALGNVPTVVLDADLHSLTVENVVALADAAREGAWARTRYNRPGRLGATLPGTLRAWSVDFPLALEAGGLLSAASAYPWPIVGAALPDHYGFDLAAALRLHEWSPVAGLRVVEGGAREHRPGNVEHVRQMAHDNLRVILDAASW